VKTFIKIGLSVNILSFFSTIIFTLLLIQGLYVLIMRPREKASLLFFLLTLCMAAWVLVSAFCYSAPNKEFIETFIRYTSFSYIFLHAFTLHFLLHHSKKRPLRPFLLVLIYGISAFFLIISVREGLVFQDFYKVGWYWQGEPNFGSPFFYLFLLQIHTYYIICYVLLFRAIRKTKKRREKIHYRIMLISLISTIVLYNLEPFVFPVLFNYPKFIFSANFSIIWSTGIWIAILRYGFFEINLEDLQQEILSNVKDAIILLKPDFTVKYVNRKAKLLLKNKQDNGRALQKDFLRYIKEGKGLQSINGTEETKNMGEYQFRFHLMTGTGPTLIDTTILKVHDRFREFLGYLVIARKVEHLNEFLERYNLTTREISVVEYILSGFPNQDIAGFMNITERTVKAHLTHIYKKMKISSKLQLISSFNNFNGTDEPAPIH